MGVRPHWVANILNPLARLSNEWIEIHLRAGARQRHPGSVDRASKHLHIFVAPINVAYCVVRNALGPASLPIYAADGKPPTSRIRLRHAARCRAHRRLCGKDLDMATYRSGCQSGMIDLTNDRI